MSGEDSRQATGKNEGRGEKQEILHRPTDAELIDICKDVNRWTPDNMSILSARMNEDRSFAIKAFNAGAQAFGASKAVYAGALSVKFREVGAPSVFLIEDHDTSEMECQKDGRVKSKFANYCKIIEQASDALGMFRFNCLSGRVTNKGAFWEIDEHPVRDIDLVNVRHFLSENYGLEDEKKAQGAILHAAQNNKYHPIREELESIPAWDGVERIKDLFPKYLGAERSAYTTEVTRLLLSGAIQRVYNPGVKFDVCVILADRQQGTGKSTMCELLALKPEWFADELGNLSDSKSAYEKIRGKWIVEMGEMLASRRTKDVESIKAYLTRTADAYRDPYAVYTEDRPRQCVFIGTTNKSGFLPPDRSGNRRFFPVFCDKARAEIHPRDDLKGAREFVRQCYAEAIKIGKRDGYRLTFDERLSGTLAALREDATPEDDLPGRIEEWLNTATDEAGKIYDVVCSHMIWEGISGPYIEPKKSDLQEVAEIMNGLPGWSKYSKSSGKYRFKNGYGPCYLKSGYGVQRAWQRNVDSTGNGDNNSGGFRAPTPEEVKEIPFK